MIRFMRTFLVVTLLLIVCGILVAPVSAATTQVHVVKYANDGTTILAEQTVNYSWMQANLPVLGDGTTHYYHQGPVFVDDPVEAVEQALRWNADEDTNVQDKDMGAVKGTDVKDLCNLVGGMSPGDTLRIRASDGMTKDFAYKNVYGYSSREGPIGLTWYTDFDFDPATPGKYPDTGYTDGMRLVWFADDGANPWGIHAFGNFDWHEAAAPEYWYYYQQGGENYPTTTGLSVKYVSELRIISSAGPVAPVAAFSGTPLSGTAPLTVQFTDGSTGTPTSWAWAFTNDGTVDSTLQSPSYTYTGVGTYTVKLTATNAGGSDDEVKTDYITVTAVPVAPVAAFATDVQSGTAPLTVHFTDASTGTPTSWAWDFNNDGTVDSTTQSPSHIYTAEGTYTVNLTVTNIAGSDSEIKTDHIFVSPAPIIPPVAAFGSDAQSGTAPLTVQFTDQSTNTPTSWAWDFTNDGTVDSAEPSPSHIYDTAGTYTVNLTVTNTKGSDSEVKTDFITVNAAPVGPVAAFGSDTQSGTAPLTVQFTDASTGTPTSWAWDFTNDGTVDSAEPSPSHIYDTAGTYTVNLTVTNAGGNDSEVKTDFITVTGAGGPKTWHVYEGQSIQAAIDGASDGDTVFVHAGTYLLPNGDVSLAVGTPNIKLKGEGADVVTLNGDGGLIAIHLGVNSGGINSPAPGCIIEGFRIVNSGTGVLVEPFSPNCIIRNNVIEVSVEDVSINASNTTIEGNLLSLTGDTGWGPVDISGCDSSTIVNNTIVGRSQSGIEVYHSANNLIARNNITTYGYAGIELYEAGEGNRIYQNNFGGNGVPVTISGSTLPTITYWTSTSPIEYTYNGATHTDFLGNYWGSNYIGTDAEGNGIGDTAFTIPDSLGSDTAPLMGAWNNGEITYTPPPVISPVAAFISDVQSGTAPLTVNFTDQSTNTPTSWAWDFTNDGTVDSAEPSPSHIYDTAGTYTVNLTVTNAGGNDSEVKTDFITVSPPAPALVWGPYLTGTTTTGTVVNVKTNIATAVTVEYATDAYYTAHSAYDQSASDSVSTQLHHVSLAGLTPDTLYHYRVVYAGQPTGDLHVSTFPESGAFTFVVYGDTQDQLPTYSQLERHKLVADRIAEEPDVAFVLNSGDLVNDASDLANWDRYFAAGSMMMANTTVYPALGNHDDNNANYYQNYGVPEYYSFDIADAHVAVLDSNDWAWPALPTQSAWLANDLQTGKEFKFISFHHPLYTSDSKHFGGWENLREAWEGDINDNGVLAVFNGHVHAYERFLVNDTNYFVAGTGGGPAYNLATPRAAGSVNSFEYALAYTKVTVDPAAGTATAQVIRVADVSTDLKSITTVYPAGTVFETVVMTNAKPPAANFTAEPEAGTMPLTVQFTDTTSGTAPFTYAWNFGDDGTSTGQSPSHTYTTYGIYTVTLTATNSAGADTETKVGFITVNQLPPDAIFTADPLSGTVPLTVQFTDHSLYAETWAWDFANDGTVDSTDQSPSHIYDTAGTYTVNLTVINTVGSSTQFTTITVLPPLPSADFTATPASGVAPLIVQFTDASTGATSWSWAFGDGATSTSQNPSHTYTTGGTYTATLTVTNAAGTSTKDMQITVTIQPLVADFAANKTSGTVPLTVAFTDASTGSPASWAWVFGDGTTSTEKNPVHKFTTAGTYTVTMTATNDGGSSSKSMTITVNPKKPVARFDQNKYSGKIPLTVKFTDKSTNNPTSYLWRFGDGTTSMEKNPSHAYTKAGVYVVRLTATNSGGSDDATSLVAALPKWWPW